MYNKNIKTNMAYRIIREDGMDQDIIIPMNNGILNFSIPDFDIFDRIQFTNIYAILLRITNQNSSVCIHLLKDIDLFSSFVNMDVNLYNKNMVISVEDNHITLMIKLMN